MIHTGDCVEVMAQMEPESVDAVVTDPPYSIGFMGRKWDQHPDEDAAFGYWLAGFTDGEGHFRVQAQSRGTYSCAFSIHLRRDDRAILERIRRFLGVGSVLDEKDTGERNPMSKLTVQSKGDCLRVVEVFTRYPLRAKKLRDFLPWAEAVFEWNGMQRGHRWSGRGDWRRLEALKARVESARAFREMPWSGHGYQDWSREWGELALRVLRPGGYLLAMGGTRTYHRMTAGLEDAGFVIRDCLVYGYASGFPKSKASLKPAWEPIVMARKPGPLRDLAIDACRIPVDDDEPNVRTTPTRTICSICGEGCGSPQRHAPSHQRVVSDVGFGPTGHVGQLQQGRWPANIVLSDPIFDGGWEGVVGGGEVQATTRGPRAIAPSGNGLTHGQMGPSPTGGGAGYTDSGTYSRFFMIPASPGGVLSDTMGTCQTCGAPIAESTSTTATPPVNTAPPSTATSPSERPGQRVFDAGNPSPSPATATAPSPAPTSPDGTPETSTSPLTDSPNTNGSETRSSSDDAATTPPTPRSKRRGTSPESEPLSSPAKSQDAASPAIDTTTTTPGRSTCATCAGRTTSATTSRSPVPADSEGYTRFLIIPKADRADREPVLGGLEKQTAYKHNHAGRDMSNTKNLMYPGDKKRAEAGRDPLPQRANHHPTVKPTDLMRHLVRLVTPAGGTVLDPFLGSGTTAIAAEMEGFGWIGIEREAEYVAIAEARLNGVQKGLGLDVPAPVTQRTTTRDSYDGRRHPGRHWTAWREEGEEGA